MLKVSPYYNTVEFILAVMPLRLRVGSKMAQFGSGLTITCGLSLLDLSSEMIGFPLGPRGYFTHVWVYGCHLGF